MTDPSPLDPRRAADGGSLLERAADAFAFTPRPLPRAVAPAKPPLPKVAAPVAVSVSPAAATVVRADDTVVPLRPTVPHRRATVDRERLAERGLLDPATPPTLLAEEFRALKRPILLDALGARGHEAVERGRAVLVGSARQGEGKTFCAINLALSLASEKDLDVLLVDADFVRPSVPDALGLEPGEGLLDALRDPAADAEALVIDTDVAGLSVLTAGTSGRDDTELLTAQRAGAVFDRLLAADPRRLILFDTPPVLAASPAAVLAHHMGQILLVVRADRTTEADVASAVEAFGDTARLHLMLNAVTFTSAGRRFGSYYGQGEDR